MENWRWRAWLVVWLAGSVAAVRALSSVPTITDWSSVEKLEHALKAATLLPIASQKLILNKIGEALAAVDEGPHCNVFGGSDACVTVPESDYAKLCDAYNQKVDCAFELEALQGIHQDPDTIMRERLSRDNGNPPCPRCYSALHKFWCAQTVPACGTFDKVVDEILPMISSVALKKASPVVALQEAVPRMLQTASLGLPCRQMCNAITDTCGCGQAATFGEVMTSINERAAEYSTNMSSSTAKDIFHNIWDTPVCKLFSDDSMPGFYGVCDVAVVEPKCEWCNRKSHPKDIHDQIVAQIAQTVSGVMQGGLQTILSEAGGQRHKNAVGSWNWGQDDAAGKKHQKKGHTGVAIMFLFLLTVAGAAFVVAAKVHRSRQNPSQYVDLNSMGYTPPIL